MAVECDKKPGVDFTLLYPLVDFDAFRFSRGVRQQRQLRWIIPVVTLEGAAIWVSITWKD